MRVLRGIWMYKREFEALLKAKKIPKASFFYGACEYQNNQAVHELLDILHANGDEKLTLYYDEYTFSTAKNFISQSSLFGDRNILIIKTDKPLSPKEAETLIELCSKNESSYLIYQFFGEDKKALSLVKLFEKSPHALFVRFFKAELNEALNMLAAHALRYGLQIDRFVLQHLYLTHTEDLSLCANEFEKLALLEREIGIHDIDQLVYGLGNISMERFIANVFEKKDLSDVYERMLEGSGIEEIRIINALQAHLGQLFLFHAYIKIHGSFDAKAILGYALPPAIAQQRAHQSIKIDLPTYHKLFELLMEIEFKLKKMSGVEKNTLLLSGLIKLQTFL